MRVTSKLGSGSFGDVYKCIDENDNEVAVKIIKADKYGIRDIIELSIMATYDHPHIVNSYDIIYRNSKIFIFQEMGLGNIYTYVRIYPLSCSLLKRWTKQLTSALCCLHREDIIHGDIKPHNILVFRDGNIKLCDFSLSIYKLEENDSYTHNMGTPVYTPYEIINGLTWGTSIDIWSLGCTLYEMSCGKILIEVKEKSRNESVVKTILSKRIMDIDSLTSRILSNTRCDPGSILSEDFLIREDGFIDIVIRCLRRLPRHRITIEDINEHDYVYNGTTTTYSIDTSSSSDIDSRMRDRIIEVCEKYTSNPKMLNIIIKLYSRCEALEMKTIYKIYGCLWIAHKLVSHKRIEKFPLQMYEIKNIEKAISEYLKFRLHISDTF